MTPEQMPVPTLASAPLSVEVRGPVHEARFPPLCAACGRRADRALPIRKLSWYDGGEHGTSHYVLGEVDAPVCAACLAIHTREAQPIAPEVRRRLVRGWLVFAVLAALPAILYVGIAGLVGRIFLDTLRDRNPPWQIALTGGVIAFFALCGLAFFRGIRRRGRQLIHETGVRTRPRYARVERGPLGSRLLAETEPTSVEQAVDFGGDIAEPFEGERHRFTFRLPEVAASFAALNAGRSWDPASRRARWARRAQWAVMIAVLGAVIAMLVFARSG